jgi:hypothetical protein
MITPWDTTAAQGDAATHQDTRDGDGGITGITAAAGYLGYDKPDSFRRAALCTPSSAKPAPPTAGIPHGRSTLAGIIGLIFKWYSNARVC